MEYLNSDGEELYMSEDIIADKLKQGKMLDDEEIRELIYAFGSRYEEEGDSGRWNQHMTTVVEVGDDFYAIEWYKGLTEMQEHTFGTQPYRVALKEVSRVVTETEIIAL